MIENKFFANGGLNQDVDENFLKPNEWEYALNIRNTDRQEFSDGVISNVKGNTLVSFSLPAGTNKCIGNYANEQTGKYYSFIWNSGGFHTITEYSPSANTIVKVLQSKTDTGGVDILNFQQYELINGVSMVENDLLYWTDGFNPPRGIIISKAKNVSNYYLTSESISLAKPPPQTLITSYYASSAPPSPPVNRLKGQLFQFKYLYVYEDGSRSAWSSHSSLPLPTFELNPANDTNPYNYNKIVLTFNVGTKYVKSIEIAALVKGTTLPGGTNDWFSILTIDRATAMTPGYNYNSVNNTADYTFFNDGLYQPLDILESDLQYDYVPLKSKTLDVVNGNVIVLGNNTEGYDNITPSVSLNVTYSSSSTQRLALAFPGEAPLTFTGYPTPGDQILVTYYDLLLGTNVTITYTVPSAALDLPTVLNNLGAFIVSNSNNTFTSYTQAYELYPPTDPETWTIAVSPGANLVSTSVSEATQVAPRSAPAYKTNSKYQMGIVYYDEFNRSSYVQTSTNMIITTKPWGEVQSQSPVINWQINHSAPLWAKRYQWVRTEQLSHQKFLFWAASSVTGDSTGNYLIFNINSLNQYSVDNPDSAPVINYEYSEGDRCTVHRNGSTWISGYDVQVASYDPVNGQLKIQKNAAIPLSNATTLIEVYTPKTRSNSPQEQFFYEFGEQYSCSGGVHSVTLGSFESGDIYTRVRTIGPTGYYLEDPNFSDFYISNYNSNGRTNIYAPQAKQLNLPTDIRFSDTYVPNTNINGLSRFYGNAYETYDRVNGSIQKLAVRDNYLITFQELKTGYIPLLQSIIEDQGVGNAANVAISNKLLNKIRYFAGDYGIGKNPESFARFAGMMYFADPNRNVVLKLSAGLEPISMIGMDGYFTNKLAFTNTVANAKILGSYDPRNDEYIISFTYPNGSNQETVAFNELINRWTTFYSFIPDSGGYIYNQYITHKNGAHYTHNTNNTYGSFYGVNYGSEVTIVYNQSPLLIKSFLALMEQANTPWAPTVIETNLGQASSLNTSDATLKEGVYFMNFLRDANSPGGLINGDDLKGNWIRMKLSESLTTKATLLSAEVRHIPSYQGIK